MWIQLSSRAFYLYIFITLNKMFPLKGYAFVQSRNCKTLLCIKRDTKWHCVLKMQWSINLLVKAENFYIFSPDRRFHREYKLERKKLTPTVKTIRTIYYNIIRWLYHHGQSSTRRTFIILNDNGAIAAQMEPLTINEDFTNIRYYSFLYSPPDVHTNDSYDL